MSPALRRISLAALALLVLSAGLAGLSLARPGTMPSAPSPSGAGAITEARLFSAAQLETAAFFSRGRAEGGQGRGLFETDFFKPPPAPPPKPNPKPPTTREIAVFYRGLAEFSGSASIAYLAVENRLLLLGAGEEVTEGWVLGAFDPDQAVLIKAEEKLVLPFNRRTLLTVPVKP